MPLVKKDKRYSVEKCYSAPTISFLPPMVTQRHCVNTIGGVILDLTNMAAGLMH